MYHRLSIHLLDILVVPNVGNYELSRYKYFYAGFCVDINFDLFWVNTRKYNCWIIWEENI